VKNKNHSKMCLLIENNREMEKISEKESSNGIGQTVNCVLLRAQLEKRTVIGLKDAVKSLSKSADDAVFCFIAPPKKGDSATLMHEVLLQAFCFENDIYIIKVSFLFDNNIRILQVTFCFIE
jgi:hypothetical protein